MSLESITIVTELEEIVLVNSVLRPTGLDALIHHLEHGLHSTTAPIRSFLFIPSLTDSPR